MSREKNNTSQKKNKVLFYIPVTSELIQQIVIALSLICRASERSIVSFFKEILDYSISLGTVHSIIEDAAAKAQLISQTEELSNVKVGAHDEIFQGDKPVLVGNCVETTYTYLLEQTDSRDSCTWGVHLLDLEKKGFRPNYTIADGARGLRAGQSQVWPSVPCFADVFHVIRDAQILTQILCNKALNNLSESYKLEKKSARTRSFSQELEASQLKAEKAVQVASTVEILMQWLSKDVLASIGGSFEQRKPLFLWIIEELEKFEPSLYGNYIKKIRVKLQN